MTLFYILVLIMLAGGSAIAWILIAEKKKESPQPEQPKATKTQISPKELLGRLGLENPKSLDNKIPLPELFKKPSPTNTQPLPQSAAIAASTQAQSELSLKYDELLAEHNELKAKYAKIEALFAEKSLNLEKSEKTLSNELKNQKEFNKLKDILEKELKDSKDKISSLQADVRTAQTETQTQLKRVSQLEEKVKILERDVLTSEAAINDAQALTQASRKHCAELEEKLKATENQIVEKNLKIEDLVNRLKDLPSIVPGNTLKDPTPKEPEPLSKTSAAIVDEKGGDPKEETPPPLALKTAGEDALIDEKSTIKNILAPEQLPQLEQKPSHNTMIPKPADGALTLPDANNNIEPNEKPS